MENQQTLEKGYWNTVEKQRERREQLKWNLNDSFDVYFEGEPYEFTKADGSVFYIFDVKVEDNEYSILTSARSLLRQLKLFKPLTGKKVSIKKVLSDGRQCFKVWDTDNPEVNEEVIES